MNRYYALYLLLCSSVVIAMDVVIVPYNRSRDFDVIQTILHDHRDVLMYESLGSPEGTTQKYIDSSHYDTYVLRCDDKTIGFINYVAYDINILTFHFGRVGLIHLLGIAKAYQGKGYGRKLLEYAVADLVKQNVSRINVSVKNGNLRAIELYKKAQFVSPITPEFAKTLLKNVPVIMTYDTGIPFDPLRGNVIQRHPVFCAIGSITGIGMYYVYKKRMRTRISRY